MWKDTCKKNIGDIHFEWLINFIDDIFAKQRQNKEKRPKDITNMSLSVTHSHLTVKQDPVVEGGRHPPNNPSWPADDGAWPFLGRLPGTGAWTGESRQPEIEKETPWL